MKKIIALLLFVSFSANAQTSKEKVLELINTMHADEMISQMMDQMIPMLKQQITSNLKAEEEKQKLDKAYEIIMDETKTFTKNIVNGPMVDVYAKYFNESDIDYMISFYKSETGVKLLKLTPTISKELMQNMMQNEMPKFQERIKNRVKEL